MPSIALPVSLRGQLLYSTRIFDPVSLFAANEPGVWYDPSDVANLNWRRNLLTWTEQFDNAAWAKSGATVSANAAAAPNGTTTADKLVENTANTNHRATQDFTVTSGLDYTFTVYAKSVERSRILLLLVLAGSFRVQTFNLNSGTVQASASSGAALTNPVATITDAGNGWFRCSLKVTTASSGVMNTGFDINNSDASSSAYLGDGTSGILIWGAQLEVGSVATEYQRITDVNTEVIERFPNNTLFQDTAGTTPVTTPGQAVALALDKSRGLVLGPELVTNGGFSNGTTGWTARNSALLSVVSGALRVELGGSFSGAIQSFTTVVGRTYRIQAQRVGGTVTDWRLRVGTSSGGSDVANITTPSVVNQYFVATSTTTFITLHNESTTVGQYTDWDNISVRELPGFHATQATAASRPTYGIVPRTGRRNLLTFTEQFDNAAWTKFNSNITQNSASSPDNTVTADKLVPTTSVALHFVEQTQTVAATQHTFSVYAKADGYNFIAIGERNGSAWSYFNLSNGTLGNTSGGASPAITSVGNGWYRCSITFTSAGGSRGGFVLCDSSNGSLANWSGNGTDGILIWGAQLETGSTATAYQRVGSQFDVTEAGVPSLSYLSFDGVDDFLVTPTITPGIDKAQVFAGVRKLSDAAQGMLIESSTIISGASGALTVQAPGPSVSYRLQSKGTIEAALDVTGISAPVTNVLSGIYDISGDRVTLRANGTQVGQSTADQGTGNFLAYPLFIGRRGGTTLPFNGNIFSLIVRFGANLDANTSTNTETWVNGKTGAY